MMHGPAGKFANHKEYACQSYRISVEEKIVSVDDDLDLSGKVDLLMNMPLFSILDPASLEILASSSKVLSFDTGQILFSQGDIGDEAHIIISGEAEVVTEGPEGDITVATIGQHQFIGEIAILIDVPRTATVTAMTDLTTLVVSKALFYSIITEFPSVGIEVMRELAHRLFQTTVQVRRLSGDTRQVQFLG